MKIAHRLAAVRLMLGFFFVLILRTIYNLYQQIQTLGVAFSPVSQMWQLLIAMSLVSVLAFVILLLTWTRLGEILVARIGRIAQYLPKSRSVNWLLLVILSLGFSFIVLIPWGDIFGLDVYRWLVFGIVTPLAFLLLLRLYPKSNWLNLLAVAGLIVAGFYRLCQFFPDISTYPFSLSWSETSRYYYGSLFFAGRIYNQSVAPSTLHPTRYLLQSAPFIIDSLPLWFNRLWQIILWLVGLLGTVLLLARRLRIASISLRLFFIIWAFLFLWQGPVYYHLLVIVILVLWGFDHRHPFRTLVVVVLASIWAGISRINWFPVPGMLAATLYFLEKPIELKDNNENLDKQTNRNSLFWNWVRYFFQPGLWVLAGTLIALGSQSAYILWSGNDPNQFASSFSSALLWYRLLPNSTYPLGILTGTLLISLPILLLIINRYRAGYVRLQPILVLALCAIIVVLLVGGLVVSVKIGGGSNLHNLDAYITLLLLVGSYYYFHQIPLSAEDKNFRLQVPAWLNLFLVAIPVFFSLSSASLFFQYNSGSTNEALLELQQNIHHHLDNGKEILFISQRHLLTFDFVPDVTLVPEFEKVFLMEMVMAGNQDYMNSFHDDIRIQRYGLIITDPEFDVYKDKSQSWAEENNVWNTLVSKPLLCYYKPDKIFDNHRIWLMVPRPDPQGCDFPSNK